MTSSSSNSNNNSNISIYISISISISTALFGATLISIFQVAPQNFQNPTRH
jgi:hypothetical protein